MGRDLERWAKRYEVAFRRNPFPFLGNTLRLMRGAVASQKRGVFDRYHPAVFSAAWGNPVDLGDEKVFQEVLLVAGIDAGEFLRSIDDQNTKDELRRATELAVERGVFGAPAFFVGGELFWGNDRLDFVEHALCA
jgi:2-hydroxychromene-2-carboxylate isomerase